MKLTDELLTQLVNEELQRVDEDINVKLPNNIDNIFLIMLLPKPVRPVDSEKKGKDN